MDLKFVRGCVECFTEIHMRWFLYVVLIPVVAGWVSGMCGVYAFKQPLLYFSINLPIIVASILYYNVSNQSMEKKRQQTANGYYK